MINMSSTVLTEGSISFNEEILYATLTLVILSPYYGIDFSFFFSNGSSESNKSE